MTEVFLLAAFLFGYFLGSIPFGMVLTKLAGTQDLRSIGSGNIGATNVLRTGRKGLAAATLIGDMLKGTIAVIIAGYYGGANAAMLAALGRFDVLPDLAGDRRHHTLLLALGAGRRVRHAAVPVVVRPPRAGVPVRRADIAAVLEAQREHQAAAGRD
jgi:hypothetical protein